MRWFKWLLLTILGLFTAVVCGVAAFVFLGPVSSPGVLLNALFGMGIPSPSQFEVRQRFDVPEGFTISLFASDLPNARWLAVTPQGELLVTQPMQGRVTLLSRDRDNNGLSDDRQVLFDELKRPHGLALHNGWLYIAESTGVGRVRFDTGEGQLGGAYERIITELPARGNHWTKTIAFGPAGELWLGMGSSCNVCLEDDERRASLMRFDADGTDGEVIASGLRNSVGLDWAPWSGALYATDNGRDMLGDNYPPDELNRIVEGGFYGWPWLNGANRPDPAIDEPLPEKLRGRAREPVFSFPAHNAPLGIRFIDSARWPARFERSALVALHGSWNRSTPDGYKVVSLHWDETGAIQSTDFVTGFLRDDGEVKGRPVAVSRVHEGCVFISDDYAGAIYKVCYNG